MARDALRVGTAEVEITPPAGTMLAGDLRPRAAAGVEGPLYVKAIVLEAGGVRLAYAVFDLAVLLLADGDRCVEAASRRTGIPADSIVFTCTHTHTGPYTVAHFDEGRDVIDHAWLGSLPEKFARAVAAADAAKVPVTMSRIRGFANHLVHNRRLTFKDGRDINTWNLGNVEDQDVQCLSSAGPVDPELGALAFEDAAGRVVAVMFHFVLHANTNFGKRFHGDYPAIVAEKLRERFGPQLVTLFLPGTFGDINSPGPDCRGVGESLAALIAQRFENRVRYEGPIRLGAVKRRLTVPYKDPAADQEERIRQSGWSEAAQEVFRQEVEVLRRENIRQGQTILQAWRIGEIGFASLPGEPFVEHGIRIKRESPFRWTFPLELGGDWQGYLVTPDAFRAGGYESLVSRVARVSVEGVELLVSGAVELLKGLADHAA